MSYTTLQFNTIPHIGFAHHFYMENYCQKHNISEKSLELVYVKNGEIIAEVYGMSFKVHEGSIFLLFRDLPYKLYSAGGVPQAHCSIQLVFDYSLSIIKDFYELPGDFNGLILPLVIAPGAETEMIKKELYTIVSELGTSREKYTLSASLAAMGILAKLDRICRWELYAKKKSASILEYKIKQYITEHIHKNIHLTDLETALEKTPNYLNSVFKLSTGLSINQYISKEKVRLIGELMENKGLSFKASCESVAIMDVSYGYRLFKKHMGVTPKTYLLGNRKS